MNWEPAHADHAIDNVSLVLSLANPIDPNTFDEIVVAGRKAAATHHFTHRVDGIEPVQVSPGVEMVIDGATIMNRRRVAFQRQADGATIGEFAIGSTGIALASSRYTSWTAFKDIALDLMRALHAVSPILNSVKIVQLQYVDAFTSTVVLADPFEVLSRTSPFLASALNDKSRALHCHSGWFEYTDVAPERVLTNVNIGVVDNSPPNPPDTKSKINILTMIRREALEGSLNDPLEYLPGQHTYLKSLFRDIITTEAAARVALNG